MNRSVQVDFTPQEARAVAAGLDLAAHLLDCCDAQEDGVDLRVLRTRLLNGVEVAVLEEQLGL